ncbi:membrane protein [Deltaproteobacteria bacterium]|nr:membrane protein [Deltaproteobacteria bacterium]
MPDISSFSVFFDWLFSFILHIDQHLFELVDAYGAILYGILFLIVFCETGLVVTPFLPGDSLLFAGGTLAGAGRLNLLAVCGIFFCAAVLGDIVNYHVGKVIGPPVFAKNYRFLNQKHLREAQAFYDRHGGKSIILARFIPIVRTFAPFVAGVANMNPARFFLFNIMGGALWVSLLVPAGYFLADNEYVREHFSLLVYAIIAVSILPIVIGYTRARLRLRERKGKSGA